MKFFIKASFKAFKENITLMGPIVYLPSPRIWLEFKKIYLKVSEKERIRKNRPGRALGKLLLEEGIGPWGLSSAVGCRGPILLLAGQEWEKGVPGINPSTALSSCPMVKW